MVVTVLFLYALSVMLSFYLFVEGVTCTRDFDGEDLRILGLTSLIPLANLIISLLWCGAEMAIKHRRTIVFKKKD